jgi:predicted Rossmann fold nucleotide-binding protein DprA/Smf involved in DNA uptake
MRIGVVGARSLPAEYQRQVGAVVGYLLDQGHTVCHGGALGCDHFVLQALLAEHSACRGILFSAWRDIESFPAEVRIDVRRYIDAGGFVSWGDCASGQPYSVVRAALHGRNQRLASHCAGLVAFIHGSSKGTLSTIRYAIRFGIPVIAFVVSGDIENLPKQKGLGWFPVRQGGIWQGSLKVMYSSLNFRIRLKNESPEKVEAICYGK